MELMVKSNRVSIEKVIEEINCEIRNRGIIGEDRIKNNMFSVCLTVSNRLNMWFSKNESGSIMFEDYELLEDTAYIHAIA